MRMFQKPSAFAAIAKPHGPIFGGLLEAVETDIMTTQPNSIMIALRRRALPFNAGKASFFYVLYAHVVLAPQNGRLVHIN